LKPEFEVSEVKAIVLAGDVGDRADARSGKVMISIS
jgi:hypothetical protein